MSAEFRRRSLIFLSCCVLLIGAVAAWSAATSKPAPSPYDDDEYKEIAASQLGSIYDLERWASSIQDDFVPILPPVPELTLRQAGWPTVLPFSTRNFPPEFTRRLSGIYENTVPVYPILVVEDPRTRALTFYNYDNEVVYTLPAPQGYDPYAYIRGLMPALYNGGASTAARNYWQSIYEPARIRVEAKLIESSDLAHWIFAKRQIEAAAALQSEGEGGFAMMMMQGEVTNTNILFTAVKRTNSNISITLKYPSGFTNGLDIFTCNEILPEIWTFAAKNLATTGTNLTWLDTNAWVTAGMPTRIYAAADAATDADGDGYTDGREMMVYGTNPNSSNSRPVSVSGTLSYSGIETGTFYVVFATETDNWSLAKSMALPSTGSYSNNEIGNGTSYWFKAFRDANGNFALDGWEPRGVYSNASLLVTGSLAGIDITVRDVPSIWGQISYSGTATGDIHVIATTGSNGWDTTYHTVIPWVQGTDTNDVAFYVTFPVNFALTGLPASDYWIRAYMDSDTNGAPSQLDVAGQYSTNALAVSNRVTGINLTMAEDSDSDGLPDWWELANFGTLAFGPDDDPDGDTLSNATEFELHTEGASPNVVSSDVVLETRSVASKRYLPYEGVQGFQHGGTYYQDIAIAASATWDTYDCMSGTSRVGQISGSVSTHFVTLTNCDSIWSGGGGLSAQETTGSYDTNVPSSSKRNEWTWSNLGVWNLPGTPWQLGVAGTTVFFACTGSTSPSNCDAAATNAPCEPPLLLLSGTATMVTNTVCDTLQQWLWDGDYSPGCTGEVIRSSQAHGPLAIELSTPITIEDLIDEVLSDVQNTNYWQESGWTNAAATPRWVHECPDQDLGCPASDSIAAYYADNLSAGAKRGQFRITVPNSTSGVVYRAVALWQRMSDGAVFDSMEYVQVSTGGTLCLTPGAGVMIEPPESQECIRVLLLTVQSLTMATSPVSRTRRTIGVGERVELSVAPEELNSVSWILHGDGSLSSTSSLNTVYTAPDHSSLVTINFNWGSLSIPLEFEIVQPSGILFESHQGEWLGCPDGVNTNVIGLGSYATVYAQPDTVNFSAAKLHEGAAVPTRSGFFSDFPSNAPAHEANGDHTLGDCVVGKGTMMLFTDVARAGASPSPFYAGSATWPLPWSYNVGDGPTQIVQTVNQIHSLTLLGGVVTLRVEKGASGHHMSTDNCQVAPN